MDGRWVRIELLEDGAAVSLRRGDAVPEEFWLQLRSEWGSSGANVSTHLVVPLERFLARRAVLGRLAQRSAVAILLSDGVRSLVEHANADQVALRAVLDRPVPLDGDHVAGRLRGTRFDRALRVFQTRDLGQLLSLLHGANFSVPGAGKTAVALAIYEAERSAGRLDRLLVIGPLSAFPAWFEETSDCFSDPPVIHRFVGGTIPSNAEVVLANYHKLASDYDVLARWVGSRPTMVVLDEAHRMKRGWEGQWGTACLNLAYLAERRDILTGTPAPQSPRDLIALVDVLWPTQAARILPADALVARPAADAGQRVAAAIKPLFVRTTKEELDLPPVVHKAIIVPLEGIHRAIYLALRDQYAGQFPLRRTSRVDFSQMGRVVMYLIEAATNPKLLTAGSLEGADPDVFRHPPLAIPRDSELADLLAHYNEYEIPAKFRELGRLIRLNAEAGRKTLVWASFVRNLKLLQKQLAAYQPALIHGGVPAYDAGGGVSRESEIARFRGDPACKVLLANPAAMSEGISLHHECHDAVYLDRTFNAGQYLQSVDRIHRLGLPAGVETRITFLLTAETIDLTVDGRVREKAERLAEMLEDPNLVSMALPDDEDYGPPIDDDLDVDALFRHLRGGDDA
jgi:hypothetical protein